MTSAEGYGVDPGEVKAHGKVVAGFADRVREAQRAAEQVGFGGVDAWGMFGGLITSAIDLVQTNTDEFIGTSADVAERLADAVQRAARSYEQFEAEAAAQSAAIENAITGKLNDLGAAGE